MEIKKETKSRIEIRKLQYLLMMLIMIIVWAFAFPFIKIGLNELSFVNLTIMRFFVVCVVAMIIILSFKNRFTKIHRKDIIPIFLLGFFGVMGYHLGLNYGEQFVSPETASLIIATIPIFIVILAIVFLREKITRNKLIGVVVALIGVIIISIWGKEDTGLEIDYVTGAFAVLIAAILGAIYTIAGKKLLVRYSGLQLTVYAMLLGSIGLIPLISVSLFEEVSNLSLMGWFAVVFLGAFSTIIGYIIWYVALEVKDASEISVFLYGVPVISTIISFFWFEHEITLFFVFGGFLVILGLYFVNIEKRKQRKR